MELEDRLMDDVKAGKEIDIERALLIFSGLQTEEEIAAYKTKLDIIDAGFQVYMEANDVPEDKPGEVAEALHNHLWKDNKKRYSRLNHFLTDVIDARFSLEDKSEGNCVGLTALYTVLGLRHGLELSVLINSTHVKMRLRNGEKEIDIENTSPQGFGNTRERDFDPFNEYGLYGLLAVTLANRGWDKKDSGHHLGSLRDSLMAKQIGGKIPIVFARLGESKAKLGLSKEAIAEYDKAIEMYGLYVNVFCERGREKSKLGDFKGALEDLEEATALEPTHIPAFKRLIEVKLKLGDVESAIEDYDWLIALNPEADLYHARGKLKEQIGDIGGALRDYDQAVEYKHARI